MGYPMAVNLRSRMDPHRTLLICDVSKDAIARFQAQMKGEGPVGVIKNGYEAAIKAVSRI